MCTCFLFQELQSCAWSSAFSRGATHSMFSGDVFSHGSFWSSLLSFSMDHKPTVSFPMTSRWLVLMSYPLSGIKDYPLSGSALSPLSYVHCPISSTSAFLSHCKAAKLWLIPNTIFLLPCSDHRMFGVGMHRGGYWKFCSEVSEVLQAS